MDVEASVDLGRFEAAVKVVDVHAAGSPAGWPWEASRSLRVPR